MSNKRYLVPIPTMSPSGRETARWSFMWDPYAKSELAEFFWWSNHIYSLLFSVDIRTDSLQLTAERGEAFATKLWHSNENTPFILSPSKLLLLNTTVFRDSSRWKQGEKRFQWASVYVEIFTWSLPAVYLRGALACSPGFAFCPNWRTPRVEPHELNGCCWVAD